MKNFFLLLLMVTLVKAGYCQPYPIGTTEITFTDTARLNRQVPVRLYYPAATAGVETPVNTGVNTYPVIVFGHGYGIPPENYDYLRDYLVPKGYILAIALTETTGNISPSRFATDMRFLVPAIKSLNSNAMSLFFNKLSGKYALGGHSMGGGCTILAAANNTDVSCVFSLAAAEISPSPIAAGANVLVPAFYIGGDRDCATPFNSNQKPMYENTAAACKAFAVLSGANHCQFAFTNAGCVNIEAGCGGTATISDTLQQYRAADLVHLFLSWKLLDVPGAESLFTSRLQNNDLSSKAIDCGATGITTSPTEEGPVRIYPNPAEEMIVITMALGKAVMVQIVDATGKEVYATALHQGTYYVETKGWAKGLYSVRIGGQNKKTIYKNIVIR